MRRKTEQDIFDYIHFLRDEGYVVALSSLNHTLLEKSVPPQMTHDNIDHSLQFLLNYEIHLCDICVRMKAQPESREKCIQYKYLLTGSPTRDVLYDCCWAGVEEYVFPVVCDDQLICRIHISGYHGSMKKSERRRRAVIHKYGADYGTLYDRLSNNIPTRAYIERLINPFVYMFEKLYHENLADETVADKAVSIYIRAVQYIIGHYMEDIYADTIAQAVNYSPSYLRTVFLKVGGKNIMEYVNVVRLTHAAEFLRFTTLPITDIAYQCGFCDGNYFATAFKKFHGITPSAYRKSFQQ